MSFFGESSLYLDLSPIRLSWSRPKWLFNPGPRRGAGVLGEYDQRCIIIGPAPPAREAIPGAPEVLEKRGEGRNFK